MQAIMKRKKKSSLRDSKSDKIYYAINTTIMLLLAWKYRRYCR